MASPPSPDEPEKKLYTVKEAAEILSVSPSWLYAKTSRKEVDHHKLGGTKFTVEDIAKLLEESKVGKEERRDALPQKKTPRRPKLNHIKL